MMAGILALQAAQGNAATSAMIDVAEREADRRRYNADLKQENVGALAGLGAAGLSYFGSKPKKPDDKMPMPDKKDHPMTDEEKAANQRLIDDTTATGAALRKPGLFDSPDAAVSQLHGALLNSLLE